VARKDTSRYSTKYGKAKGKGAFSKKVFSKKSIE
jgi:hypothetical protein